MTSEELFPIGLSLRVALSSVILIAPIGAFVAARLAHGRFRFRALVDAVILIPLILPPSVVGFLLVILLGRRGPVGSLLERLFDAHIVFSPTAAVIASSVVAFPLFVKTLEPSLASVPRPILDVARTLGLGPVEVFFRVSLPMAWRGLLAASALAFARAAGEFGATLMLAGNIPGRTNTMPIEVFVAYQSGHDERAYFYVAVLSLMSLAVALLAARAAPSEARS